MDQSTVEIAPADVLVMRDHQIDWLNVQPIENKTNWLEPFQLSALVGCDNRHLLCPSPNIRHLKVDEMLEMERAQGSIPLSIH